MLKLKIYLQYKNVVKKINCVFNIEKIIIDKIKLQIIKNIYAI